MAALFAIFLPLGAIILRLSKSPKAAWIHGIWQTASYIGALAGFGIGVYLATVEDEVNTVLSQIPWAAGTDTEIVGRKTRSRHHRHSRHWLPILPTHRWIASSPTLRQRP